MDHPNDRKAFVKHQGSRDDGSKPTRVGVSAVPPTLHQHVSSSHRLHSAHSRLAVLSTSSFPSLRTTATHLPPALLHNVIYQPQRPKLDPRLRVLARETSGRRRVKTDRGCRGRLVYRKRHRKGIEKLNSPRATTQSRQYGQTTRPKKIPWRMCGTTRIYKA